MVITLRTASIIGALLAVAGTGCKPAAPPAAESPARASDGSVRMCGATVNTNPAITTVRGSKDVLVIEVALDKLGGSLTHDPLVVLVKCLTGNAELGSTIALAQPWTEQVEHPDLHLREFRRIRAGQGSLKSQLFTPLGTQYVNPDGSAFYIEGSPAEDWAPTINYVEWKAEPYLVRYHFYSRDNLKRWRDLDALVRTMTISKE
ncbi:hypothetical protein [Stenotrophomonas sp. CFBP 13725]|uniref:hypothetical protein n=1 Tax=Stenotrophomonas sp. CFBP 13725 TaxID=2775297 RepID=UPI0017875673|nr:hypothetical protein [Stenotrophomonas sp. CFBP 13725]MBD8634483.1 hypothetical protein [Stenotrophomonas sp. CFBP 13725]